MIRLRRQPLTLMVARIYRTCGRCDAKVRRQNDIVDDGHGRGVCCNCHWELMRKAQRRALRDKFLKCSECGKTKPRSAYSKTELKYAGTRRVVNGFTHEVQYLADVVCETCKTISTQVALASEAQHKLRTRAIMSLVSGSRLRKQHLPDELIETKITQMKVLNLWQTPKI